MARSAWWSPRLRAIGIDGPAWFVDQNTALVAVIQRYTVWTAYPLIAQIVLAAMQSIPGELYEAATLDGASPATGVPADHLAQHPRRRPRRHDQCARGVP